MKKIQWSFLLLALSAAACLIGIGFSIAAKSLIGIITSIILLIVIMGLGFMKKKKMRENGII